MKIYYPKLKSESLDESYMKARQVDATHFISGNEVYKIYDEGYVFTNMNISEFMDANFDINLLETAYKIINE